MGRRLHSKRKWEHENSRYAEVKPVGCNAHMYSVWNPEGRHLIWEVRKRALSETRPTEPPRLLVPLIAAHRRRVLLGVRGIRSVHTYIPPPPCHAAEGGALLLFSCACGSDAHCASHTRPHRTQKCAPVRCAIRVEPGGCLQRTTPRANSAGDMKTVRPERCWERWTHACAAPHSLVVETRPLFLFIGARVRAPRHPRHCPA